MWRQRASAGGLAGWRAGFSVCSGPRLLLQSSHQIRHSACGSAAVPELAAVGDLEACAQWEQGMVG